MSRNPVPFICYRGLTDLDLLLYHVDDLDAVCDKHMGDIVYNTGTNMLHLGHPRDRNGLRDQINAEAVKLPVLPVGSDYLVVLAESKSKIGAWSDHSSGLLAGLDLRVSTVRWPAATRSSMVVSVSGFGYVHEIRLITGELKRAVEVTAGALLDGEARTAPSDALIMQQAAASLQQFFRAVADRLDWILSQAVAAIIARANVYALRVSDGVNEAAVSVFGGILSVGLTNAHNQYLGSSQDLVGNPVSKQHAALLRARYTSRAANSSMSPNLVDLAAVFGKDALPLPGLEHAALGIDTVTARLA